MRILVADDVIEIRTLFTTILSRRLLDSTIDAVVNGSEAVDAFRTGNYDVIVLDIQMPVKDGYQACLEIQELCGQEKRKMPFVIFCTGSSIPKEIKKLLADKTHFALLKKPMDCHQIIETFEAVRQLCAAGAPA